jgi:hypothetical protein
MFYSILVLYVSPLLRAGIRYTAVLRVKDQKSNCCPMQLFPWVTVGVLLPPPLAYHAVAIILLTPTTLESRSETEITKFQMSAGNDQVSRRFLQMTDPSTSVTEEISASVTEETNLDSRETKSPPNPYQNQMPIIIQGMTLLSKQANFLGNSGAEYRVTNGQRRAIRV